jgi:hypothetical protein
MAFDTVGLESCNSLAARANEPVSATLAKIAQASKSGNLIVQFRASISFYHFCSFTFDSALCHCPSTANLPNGDDK